MDVGDIIAGKFELTRFMGTGSMGTVFEGRHNQLGHRVALKFLRTELCNDVESTTRFMLEGQAAAGIGSEHIVTVTDVGHTDDGVPYMVMEYLEGRTLAKALRSDGPFDPKKAARLLIQACRALAAAHEKGIIHRDIKPDNIHLVPRDDGSEHVKVLDFGIAKILDLVTGQSPNLTADGTTVGTPYYMAPEQARAEKNIDGRADVYSLGVVLYELMTGKQPFTGTGFSQIVIMAATQDATPPKTLRPDLPDALEQLILKAMARDKEERFANMRELADALEPFAEGQTAGLASGGEVVEATVPTQGPPTAKAPALSAADTTPPAPRRSMKGLIIIGIVIILVIGIAALVGTYYAFWTGVEVGASHGGDDPPTPVAVPPAPVAPPVPPGPKPPDAPDAGEQALPQPTRPDVTGADPGVDASSDSAAAPTKLTPAQAFDAARQGFKAGLFTACLESLDGVESPAAAKLRIRCHYEDGSVHQACRLAGECADTSRWCKRFVSNRCQDQ